jgi:hypothetical protein
LGPAFAQVVAEVHAIPLNCPVMGKTYLSTARELSRTSMNPLRYQEFQFGVGTGESAEAVLISAPREGSSGVDRMLRERRLPREAEGPRPHSPPTAHPLDGL